MKRGHKCNVLNNNFSLGGVLTSTGSGVIGGTPLGIPGMVAGGALGLAKGIFQHRAEKSAEETAAQLEQETLTANKQATLSGFTSRGGESFNAAGKVVNPFQSNLALGGPASGLPNPGDELETFDNGGTHEENPLGGIQIGKDANGVPNTVEENESAANINGKRYVYSNRIPFINRGEFPKFMKDGGSYSDAAKALDKAFKNRTSEYDMATINDLRKRLAVKQETVKELQQNPGLSNPDEVNAQNQLHAGGIPGHPHPHNEVTTNNFHTANIAQNVSEVASNPFTSFGNPNPNIFGQDYIPPEADTSNISSTGFFQRNQDSIAMGAAGLGALTQLGGVFSNIRARNKLERPQKVQAQLADASGIKANLVNRQGILRNIAGSQQSTIGALGNRASGSFGAFAANVAGVQAGTSKAISNAMLQSDQLDIAEKARVQQLQLGASQFNAKSRMQADVANTQNRAAFETQRNLYTQGISANLGSLGQSLINFGIGTTAGKYQGMGDVFGALGNQQQRRRVTR